MICNCYDNWFEKKDARVYLCNTLKQNSISFEEYYNFFAQKKEKSQIEDISLIDIIKKNVNYNK